MFVNCVLFLFESLGVGRVSEWMVMCWSGKKSMFESGRIRGGEIVVILLLCCVLS